MTALINPAIVSHIEYLCDEAEWWQERERFYLARGDESSAAWAREQWEKSEARAMGWAEKLEAA